MDLHDFQRDFNCKKNIKFDEIKVIAERVFGPNCFECFMSDFSVTHTGHSDRSDDVARSLDAKTINFIIVDSLMGIELESGYWKSVVCGL